MKKISKIFSFVAFAMAVTIMPNVYATETLVGSGQSVTDLSTAFSSAQDNDTIKLDSDITLTTEAKVDSSKHLTLDLNGHKVTGPSTGYAFNNEGTLTIKDSSETKNGSIECTTEGNNSSCVRSAGTLSVSDVTINSTFVALKNEPNGNMTVTNSNIKSTYGNTDSGAIFSYGKTTINNSVIESPARNGIAIYALQHNGVESSVTVQNNSTVKGGWDALLAVDSSSITFDNSKLEGNIQTTSEANVDLTGDVKVGNSFTTLRDALKYAEANAKVTLTEDFELTSDLTVPENVTLVIPDSISLSLAAKGTSHGTLTVNGNIEQNGTLDAAVYNERGVYYASLEKAMVNVKDDETLEVLKDIDETEFVWAAKKTGSLSQSKSNVTVDLNGHNVKTKLTNNEGASLTLVDSSEDKSGTFDGTITNKGTLDIQGGSYSEMPITEDDAETTLTGGTYPSDAIQNAEIPQDKLLVEDGEGNYTIEDKADYSQLQAAVTAAESNYDANKKYTKASEDTFNAALTAAKALLADQNISADAEANDGTIAAATTNLQNALLVEVTLDDLEAALNTAKTMYAEATSEDPEVVYTERSIKTLEDLISRVEDYLEEAVYESQDEIDALVDEFNEVELIEKADYTDLEELLDGIGEIDEKAYTKELLAALYTVLQTIHGDLSVEEMRVVMANLEDAIANLKLVPVEPEQRPVNPDTLDNAMSYVVMMIMAVVAMVIGVVARKEANER